MEKIKDNLKYIFLFIVILILLCISYILYNNMSKKEVKKEKEVVVEKKKVKKEEEKEEEKEYIYVDIKGAVNSPGVYMLEEGKRVIDIINVSGGLKEEADTSIINLSMKLTDEMCIIIYTKSEIDTYRKQNLSAKEIVKKLEEDKVIVDDYNDAKISTSKNDTKNNSETNEKVSINTATLDELLTISGIGESKANAIIKYREENGEFKSIEDIKNVSGIGDSLFEKIKDSITV